MSPNRMRVLGPVLQLARANNAKTSMLHLSGGSSAAVTHGECGQAIGLFAHHTPEATCSDLKTDTTLDNVCHLML